MKDSKLTDILSKLEPDEFRQFEKFVDSPYHNKGRNLLPLLKVLKIFYPEFDHKNLNNEFIFGKLFPEKKIEGSKAENLIRGMSSHLFALCKDFLIQIEMETQKAKRKYFLLNQLRKKKLYKEYDKEFGNAESCFETPSKGSIGYFVDKHLVSEVNRECLLDRDDFKNSFEYRLKTSENIAAAALISVFKFEDEKILAIAYNIQLRENVLDEILKNFNNENFISGLQTIKSEHFPYLWIFNLHYMMNKDRDTSRYYELKEHLKKHASLFGQTENYELWNSMSGYAAANNIKNEWPELYKFMLENGIHKPLSSENFHVVLFRNIVMALTRVDPDWTEKFIEQYSPELHESHRDDMKNYSMAYISFERSEFEQALNYISKIQYNLFLYKLDMKLLQSQIYYELGYYEEGLTLISAILSYVNESKEIGDHSRKSSSEQSRLLKDLIMIRLNSTLSGHELDKLKLAVKDMKGNSGWLLKKIDELNR